MWQSYNIHISTETWV